MQIRVGRPTRTLAGPNPHGSVFPREGLATTAGGRPVSEWPDACMTNLVDAAEQIGGRTPPGTRPTGCVNQVLRARVWDGIFPTFGANQVWSADHAPGTTTSTARTPQTGRPAASDGGGNAARLLARFWWPTERERCATDNSTGTTSKRSRSTNRCGFSADITPPWALAAARSACGRWHTPTVRPPRADRASTRQPRTVGGVVRQT